MEEIIIIYIIICLVCLILGWVTEFIIKAIAIPYNVVLLAYLWIIGKIQERNKEQAK